MQSATDAIYKLKDLYGIACLQAREKRPLRRWYRWIHRSSLILAARWGRGPRRVLGAKAAWLLDCL